MTVDELQVLITANTTALQKEIAKTNNTISGLKKSADKTQSGVTSAFSKLKQGIVALGIGKVIADSINLGMDAIESDNLFEVSMGNMADSVREWSEEVGNALGLNATEMRKNVGTIYNMTTSMGLAGDNALKMSKGVTLLANDMASFYNLSTEEAFNKINAGLTGETEPLKRLGILVDENTIKQVAYQQGIAETGAELTQQQKVLARYCAILQQTGNAQGDLARTLDSPSNQLRQLKSQVQQLGITFGSFFMPILQAVIPYVTAFVNVISYALNSLSKFLGLNSTNATEETANISSNVIGIGSGLDDADKSAKKLKKTMAGFDEMNVLQDTSSDSGGSAGAGVTGGDIGFELGEYDAGLDQINSRVDDITDNMINAFKEVGEFAKTIWETEPVQVFVGAVQSKLNFLCNLASTLGTNLWSNLQATWLHIEDDVSLLTTNMGTLWSNFWTGLQIGIETWGQPIIDGVTGVFNSIWKDAIDPTIQLITKKWSDFSSILLTLWDEHGQPLIDNIGNFALQTVSLFQSIWDNVIEPIVTPFLESLSWLWDKHLSDIIYKVGNLVVSLVNETLEIYNKFIQPIVKFLLELLAPAWSYLSSGVIGALGSIFAAVSDSLSGIIGALGGLVDFLVGIFTLNWSKAWSGLKSVFKNVVDSLVGVFKLPINLIIDGINAFISGLNKIKIPDWVPAVGGKGINIPKIPKLARGGIIDEPTLAVVGEAGKEAVMPLENNTGWINQLANKLSENTNSKNPIQFVVKIGEDTILDKLIDGIRDKDFETNGGVFEL